MRLVLLWIALSLVACTPYRRPPTPDDDDVVVDDDVDDDDVVDDDDAVGDDDDSADDDDDSAADDDDDSADDDDDSADDDDVVDDDDSADDDDVVDDDDACDLDGDGFEGPFCSGPDCDDLDNNAFPGQTAFFASSRSNGSFDYNCDGAETMEWTSQMACSSCGPHTVGWWWLVDGINAGPAPAPPCGFTGNFGYYCYSDCTYVYETGGPGTINQTCR
jgi:hypothetical protein